MQLLIYLLTFMFFANISLASEFDASVVNLKFIGKNNTMYIEFTEGEFSELDVGRTIHRFSFGDFNNSVVINAVYNDLRETLSFRNSYNFRNVVLEDVRVKAAGTFSYVGNVNDFDHGDFYLSSSIEATKPLTTKYYLYGKYGVTWALDGLDKSSEYFLIGVPIAINRTTFITPNIVKANVYTDYGMFDRTQLEIDLTFLF